MGAAVCHYKFHQSTLVVKISHEDAFTEGWSGADVQRHIKDKNRVSSFCPCHRLLLLLLVYYKLYA